MKVINQKDLHDSKQMPYRSSECEHVDDDGKRHSILIRTSAEGEHNIVVDHGGIDNIGYGLSDDGLTAFLVRLFGKR